MGEEVHALFYDIFTLNSICFSRRPLPLRNELEATIPRGLHMATPFSFGHAIRQTIAPPHLESDCASLDSTIQLVRNAATALTRSVVDEVALDLPVGGDIEHHNGSMAGHPIGATCDGKELR